MIIAQVCLRLATIKGNKIQIKILGWSNPLTTKIIIVILLQKKSFANIVNCTLSNEQPVNNNNVSQSITQIRFHSQFAVLSSRLVLH